MEETRQESTSIIDYVLLGMGSSKEKGSLDFIIIINPAEIEKLLKAFAKVKGVHGGVPPSIRSKIAGKIALLETLKRQQTEKYQNITPDAYDAFTIAEKEAYCNWLIKQVKIGFDRYDNTVYINIEYWDWDKECFCPAYDLSGIGVVLYRIKPEPAEEV